VTAVRKTMMDAMPDERSEIIAQMVDSHANVGRHKPVSYLPLTTIETAIGTTTAAYQAAVEESGNRCILLGPDESCIESGAAYAYSEPDLSALLDRNKDLLRKRGWPIEPADFIRRLGSEWLPQDDPVMPVIRAAFGD
jgi:hypothetical protein